MPKIVDAHRLVGPVPFDDLPADPRSELDRLGIEQAYVTHALGLYSDAAAGNRAVLGLDDSRLIPVPTVVPGVSGASEPATAQAVTDWGVRLVRLCPQRHGFDLTGPTALEWLERFRLPVAIDFDETTPAQLRQLAERLPDQRILLLNPGYRRLRTIAELLTAIPNLWLEIGTVNTQGGVEWLAQRYGAGRLVFGTGAPVLDDCGPRFLLDHLVLPAADVALIASGSLEALL